MITLTGTKEESPDLKFCCKIQVKDDFYTGFVTSKYHEFDILKDDRIVYSAKIENISKLNIFLNRLILTFSDLNNDLFKVTTSDFAGIFGYKVNFNENDQAMRIPKSFSFSMPEIGFEINMEKENFQSKINDNLNPGIGIGLSYFNWVRQQRWLNID